MAAPADGSADAPGPETPIFDIEPGIKPSDVHVLLADDEKLSRVVISNLLKRCGYPVTSVENGAEALEQLKTQPPGTFQLILSDVSMPGLSGPELLRFVRQTPSLHYLPVVMMSAHEQVGTVFECIRRGAEDYLLKPVTLKEVQHIWQHVWRRRFSFMRVKDDAEEEQEDPAAEQPKRKKKRAAPEAGEEDDNEDEDEEDADLYTVEEMRTHCLRQIERYQKVLALIDARPELFKPGAAGAAGVKAAA